MAAINRGQSPMYVLRENLNDSRDEAQQKKRKLESKQMVKTPFLIGSIDEVSKKVSQLDRKLQNYTQLVIESRVSDKTTDGLDIVIRPPTTRGKDFYIRREKENKELNQFAGVFAIQSAVGVQLSDRVKHISKISLQPNNATVKKESGKPKFAELHQFPGYDPTELTPLPNEITPRSILTKAADAWPRLAKMTHYKPEFEKLFYSQMSQAVLQDTFWWLFLEKYQASKHNQAKLFNRVAHNYVKLLTYAKHPSYREVFLRDYPSLLAQAVYAAFCEAFPDSYRQFGEPFKEDLIALVYEWVAGVKPAPRTWMLWNLDALEPANIKSREDIMNQSKQKKSNGSSALNLDFLDELSPSSHLTGSRSQFGSTSSLASQANRYGGKSRRHAQARKSVGQNTTESSVIEKVANAQKDKVRGSSQGETPRSKQPDTKRDNPEGLAPIEEFDEDKQKSGAKLAQESKMSFSTKRSGGFGKPPVEPRRESHPAGKGPKFIRGIFNIHGQSPLVAHFMRMQNLQPEAGTNVRIQRTELQDLPPLNAKTYRDVIKESYTAVRNIGKQHQSLVEKGIKESSKFNRNQRQAMKEYERREDLLLANSQEVKRLSDLIVLEQRKDQESIKAGADAAIAAAMDKIGSQTRPRAAQQAPTVN